MCTLTYLPTKSGFILTHSRDENPKRPSSQKILKHQLEGHTLYFPEDLEAKGTWMGMSAQRSACVLNGGTVPYQRQAPYQFSRGALVPSVLQAAHVQEWYKYQDFTDFEPFTLLVKEPDALYRVVHNPSANFLEGLSADAPHIWSSTKLYSPEVRANRKQQFKTWLRKQPELKPENVAYFHLHGDSQENLKGYKMKVTGLIETVSLTQVYANQACQSLLYHHLVSQQTDQVQIS